MGQKIEVEWIDCRDELPPTKPTTIFVGGVKQVEQQSKMCFVTFKADSETEPKYYIIQDRIVNNEWFMCKDNAIAWLKGLTPYKEEGDPDGDNN